MSSQNPDFPYDAGDDVYIGGLRVIPSAGLSGGYYIGRFIWYGPIRHFGNTKPGMRESVEVYPTYQAAAAALTRYTFTPYVNEADQLMRDLAGVPPIGEGREHDYGYVEQPDVDEPDANTYAELAILLERGERGGHADLDGSQCAVLLHLVNAAAERLVAKQQAETPDFYAIAMEAVPKLLGLLDCYIPGDTADKIADELQAIWEANQ